MMPGLSGKLLPADGGEDGSRTHDLLNAIQTLSQLSYNPKLSLASLQIIEGMTVLSLIRRQLYWCMRRGILPQVLSDIPALGPGRVYFFCFATHTMVPKTGLEPVRLSASDFESDKSTNFITRAYGGPYRTRTGHLKLARLALSQMS